jgi:hypothetical protein
MTTTEIKPRAGKQTGELYRICLRESIKIVRCLLEFNYCDRAFLPGSVITRVCRLSPPVVGGIKRLVATICYKLS